MIKAAQEAECSIENVRKDEESKVAELTLLKFCAPSTDSGLFNLRIDDVDEIDQPCGGQVGPLALAPGTYHALVGETAGSGTNLSDYTSVIGGACTTGGSIHLTAGQSETCTITNVRKGTQTAVLTVVKRCQPANDTGRFVLDINEESFRGMRCGQSTGPVTLETGSHLVGEVAIPSNIADFYETEFGGDCAATGIVTLTAHEHATCTVTNIRISHSPVSPEREVKPRPKPKPKPPAFTG